VVTLLSTEAKLPLKLTTTVIHLYTLFTLPITQMVELTFAALLMTAVLKNHSTTVELGMRLMTNVVFLTPHTMMVLLTDIKITHYITLDIT